MTVLTNDLSKIYVNKKVTPNKSSLSINTILTYSITLENIYNENLEYVHIIEDILDGLVYIPRSLKINGKYPSCGDINLNEDAIIPIGTLLPYTLSNSCHSNRVVVTFDVSISRVPIQNPISNFCRVLYKYRVSNKLVCNIVNSNIVYSDFNLDIKNEPFIELVDGSTFSYKGPGDPIQFKIILNPKNSIKNVVLYDYLNDAIELSSIEIIKNGFTTKKSNINISKLPIGSIDCNESVTIILNGKIKNNINLSSYSLIKNQVSIKYLDNHGSINNIVCKTNPVYIYIYTALVKSSKEANQEYVSIGDTISYTIDIENCGTVPLLDLVVKDILPTSLEYISDSAYIQYENMPPCNIDYIHSEGNIYIGILDISESVKIVLKTKVISTPLNSDKKIINSASIDYKYLKYPNNPNNKYEYIYDKPISRVSAVYVNGPDLLSSFKKKVLNNYNCTSSQIDYELSFTNTGDFIAKKVNILDIIKGAKFIQSSLIVLTNMPSGPKKYFGELPNISLDCVLPNESIIIRFSALVLDSCIEKTISNYSKLSYIYSLPQCNNPIQVSGNSNTVYTNIHYQQIDNNLYVNESLSASVFVNDDAIYRIKLKNISESSLLSVSYKVNFSGDFSKYISYKSNSLKIIGGTSSSLNINPNLESICVGTILPNESIDISFTEIGLQQTSKPITCVATASYYVNASNLLKHCTDNTNLVSLTISDCPLPPNPNWCWSPYSNNCSNNCSYCKFNNIGLHNQYSNKNSCS